MKHRLLIVISFVCTIIGLLVLFFHTPNYTEKPRQLPKPSLVSATGKDLSTAAPPPPKTLAVDERAHLPNSERLEYLEAFGSVPADADSLDWKLAQKTSWWENQLIQRIFGKTKSFGLIAHRKWKRSVAEGRIPLR